MTKQILASAARTTSGSLEFDLDGSKDLRVYLDVTAFGGTSPTLDVKVLENIHGVWFTVSTFAQKVAAGQEILSITAPRTGEFRIDYTIAGAAASFTFSVSASQ